MVFNILVGSVWNGGGGDGKVRACVQVRAFVCVTPEVGDKGGSGKESVFERGTAATAWAFYVFVRLGSPSVVWVFDEVLG